MKPENETPTNLDYKTRRSTSHISDLPCGLSPRKPSFSSPRLVARLALSGCDRQPHKLASASPILLPWRHRTLACARRFFFGM